MSGPVPLSSSIPALPKLNQPTVGQACRPVPLAVLSRRTGISRYWVGTGAYPYGTVHMDRNGPAPATAPPEPPPGQIMQNKANFSGGQEPAEAGKEGTLGPIVQNKANFPHRRNGRGLARRPKKPPLGKSVQNKANLPAWFKTG